MTGREARRERRIAERAEMKAHQREMQTECGMTRAQARRNAKVQIRG